MFSERLFQFALTVSIILHGVVLSQIPGGFNLQAKNRRQEKVEVVYLKDQLVVKAAKGALAGTRVTGSKREPLLRLSSKVTMGKSTPPPPYVDREEIFNQGSKSRLPQYTRPTQSTYIKPGLIESDIVGIKKRISLPPVETEKIKNPSYINYYQLVREKIRRAAYQNYTRTDIGEVYVSFIVSGDGSLKDMRLVEEKSSSNKYLKETALRSVRSASPFPAFPKELDYPQLSFNIAISFEIE
jgi:TonB family protein